MRKIETIILIILDSIITAITVVGLMLIASEATARVIDLRNPNLVLATGEVDESYLGRAGFLDSVADNNIDILINSPGGNIMLGNIFIQAMEAARANGKNIRCVVTNLAASMAMHILAHCNERYALKGAYLLYHEGRLGMMGVFTARELKAKAATLESITADLEIFLKEQLGVTDEFYRKHNEGETMWSIGEFIKNHPNFPIRIIDDVLVEPKFRKLVFSPVAATQRNNVQPGQPPAVTGGAPASFPKPLILKEE